MIIMVEKERKFAISEEEEGGGGSDACVHLIYKIILVRVVSHFPLYCVSNSQIALIVLDVASGCAIFQ